MSVEVHGVGRTRQVEGEIYLERWVQIDAGTDLIYGTSPVDGDLNTLDRLADSETAAGEGRRWYGAASPGPFDAGERNEAWFGQVIRVPFRILQQASEWHLLKARLLAFVEAAFPDELILESNRRFERPELGSPTAPAKFVLFAIDFD